MRGFLRVMVSVEIVLASTSLALAQGPGTWSPVQDWSCQILLSGCDIDEFSHACVIPTGPHRGKVLLWRNTCSGTTTETWIFNPDSTDRLVKVSQGLPSDIFCSGMSWDPTGNLVVAGGIGGHIFPAKTYKFRPRVLTGTNPPGLDPCTQPATIGGSPWLPLQNMNVGRYYPTVMTLLRRAIANSSTPAIVAGGATLVLGGPWFRPTPPPPPPNTAPTNNVGNEWWDVLAAGLQVWHAPIYPTQPLISPPLPPGAPGPPTTFEGYSRHMGGGMSYLPEVLLDSYPRALQLADIGQI